MAESDIHLNDIGTIFEIATKEDGVAVDISTQTDLSITLTKPDGTKVVKTAALSGDGTDGKFRYVSIADDLNQTGPWKIQGKITLPTWIGNTGIGEFSVAPNL